MVLTRIKHTNIFKWGFKLISPFIPSDFNETENLKRPPNLSFFYILFATLCAPLFCHIIFCAYASRRLLFTLLYAQIFMGEMTINMLKKVRFFSVKEKKISKFYGPWQDCRIMFLLSCSSKESKMALKAVIAHCQICPDGRKS